MSGRRGRRRRVVEMEERGGRRLKLGKRKREDGGRRDEGECGRMEVVEEKGGW